MYSRRKPLLVGFGLAGVLLLALTGAAAQAAPSAAGTRICPAGATLCYESGALPPLRPGARSGRAGGSGPVGPNALAGPNALPAGYPFWELQMNLCNSGFASCYQSGKSVGEAASKITAVRPDLVTLNEICRPDVTTLLSTMQAAWPGDVVYWAFAPAGKRLADGTTIPYLCKNNVDQYGIGVLGHVPAADWQGVTAVAGWYAAQDTAHSNEIRAYLCTNAIGNFFGCTTHLSNTSGSVALAQCQNLMNTVIPQVWSSAGGSRPTVVGGDLNLKYKGSPDAQSCVPSGWFRKGDGDVQHVMATTSWTFDFTESFSMRYTDHPAWLVALIAN
jgi:hypothetical protein